MWGESIYFFLTFYIYYIIDFLIYQILRGKFLGFENLIFGVWRPGKI